MALDDILSALDEQAESNCAALASEAQDRAAAIVEQAKQEAVRIAEECRTGCEQAAEREAGLIMNAARLKAAMVVSSARGAAVAEVFDTAWSRLSDVRRGAGYPDALGAMLDEALGNAYEACEVRVNPDDVATAKQRLNGRGAALEVVPDKSIIGGVLVVECDGRVTRRNTLESRFERARELIAPQVAETLFE